MRITERSLLRGVPMAGAVALMAVLSALTMSATGNAGGTGGGRGGAAVEAARPADDGQVVSLRSPGGDATITLSAGRTFTYAVTFRGQPVILPSSIELSLEGTPAPIGPDLRVMRQERRSIDGTWTAVHGKRRQVRDRAEEVTLELVETGPAARRLDVVLRAYDDGVAFRYGIPSRPGLEEFHLQAERTQIRFAGDHPSWAADYGGFTSSQESEFRRTSVDALTPQATIGLPLLVRAGERAWVAVTESDLIDWAGMYLRKTPEAHTFETILSPRPDRRDLVVVGTTRRWSPWRVFLLGDHPGALIEADLVRNLATPSQVADTRWIKPGRAAWDRWWSGDYDPDAKVKPAMNTATMQSFIELAGQMGWEYQIIDWTWYPNVQRPDADLTKINPAVDLPALVQFASQRKVGLWLWARWNHLDRQMETAFPLFQSWGIKGVKVDFMDRDDQVMVNYYWRLAKVAAQNHLLLDLHGAYKPTGLERTWPNLLTREGVLGNEYNKWSKRVTPTHKVTLPFTRMLAGPMDFTPGGFRHSSVGGFLAKDRAPLVMGTRAAELALTVVYESALLVLCDSPYEYRHAGGQGGIAFLKQVPAAWDEVRVLEGMPGELIVIARRAGDRWFVAGLGGETARQTRVALSFLGPGSQRLSLWSDAPDAAQRPEKVVETTRDVTSRDTLAIELAPGGGFAAIIAPAPAPAPAPVPAPAAPVPAKP